MKRFRVEFPVTITLDAPTKGQAEVRCLKAIQAINLVLQSTEYMKPEYDAKKRWKHTITELPF